MTRINEDIRFYLPADPYYYQVDNLPLKDLLNNDVRLQDQIDVLVADNTSTVSRDGFTELQPFINGALPGTVSVRPGNFIGRTQRTSDGELPGSTVDRMNQGIQEIGIPPTTPPSDYNVNVDNAVDVGISNIDPDKFVGRTSVFNFFGGSINIDGFDFTAFEGAGGVTPPLGRIDLVGITTVNGAMDDPFLPGNPTGTGQVIGDGYPKLAVVQGAGIVQENNNVREVIIGEKYITVGTPQEGINDYGRDLNGTIVPNPTFGTIPSPDDIVNVCFSNDTVMTELGTLAAANQNASFFLPLAYVYVPQSHVNGNPIPRQNLKDIRPLLRTAELSLQERQSLAAAVNPSYRNPVITNTSLETKFVEEIDRTNGSQPIQAQIQELRDEVETITVERSHYCDTPYLFRSGSISNGATYNVTNAILPEHRAKTIKTLYVYMRPYGGTGDIGSGWVGVETLGGFAFWLMNWGNRVEHTSTITPAPGNGNVAARVDGDGNVTVKTRRTGTSQNVYAYIAGYCYEDTITL